MTGTYRHFYMRTEEKAGQTPTLYVGSLGRGIGLKRNKWRMSWGKYGKMMIKHRGLNILDGFT